MTDPTTEAQATAPGPLRPRQDDEGLFEAVPCPLCGADRPKARHEGLHDKLGLTEATFTLVTCGACEMAYLSPRPTASAIGRFYPDAYWHKATDAPPKGLAALPGRLEAAYREALLGEELARIFPLLPADGRWLDVGCGAGDLLAMAKAAGRAGVGVEFSPEAVRHARDARGLDVRQGALEQAGFPDSAFDVVSLFHVLEHLPDPVATLRECRRVLKPGGALVVQVPNFGGRQAARHGARWYAIDAPRHFHHWTSATLRRAFETAGFAVASEDHRSFRCNPVILASTLFPALEPHHFSAEEAAGRAMLVKKAAYLGLTWAVTPWAWLEERLGGSAVLTMTGRVDRA